MTFLNVLTNDSLLFFYPFIDTFYVKECPQSQLVPVITNIIAARRISYDFNRFCKINASTASNFVQTENLNAVKVISEGLQIQAILQYNYVYNIMHKSTDPHLFTLTIFI